MSDGGPADGRAGPWFDLRLLRPRRLALNRHDFVSAVVGLELGAELDVSGMGAARDRILARDRASTHDMPYTGDFDSYSRCSYSTLALESLLQIPANRCWSRSNQARSSW